MKKTICRCCLALLLIAALLPGCTAGAYGASGEPAASGESASAGPSEELPLTPGTYEGSDGSILNVERDGTCAYEALVSGTINGVPMSGRLTFHGTVEGGAFSFTKVTYYGLDLTEIARALGLDDASPWEQAAAVIYASAMEQSAAGTIEK